MFKYTTIFLILFSGVAFSASFDCSKANSNLEKMICNTPSLSKSDDDLYINYKQAKQATGNSDAFRNIAKENWKLRESICKTEDCLLRWYKYSTALYKNIANGEIYLIKDKCYKEGDSVTLSGTLIRKTLPGPPNYESVEQGDEAETYWYLKTSNEICMEWNADWGEKNLYQLLPSGDFYEKNRKYLNQKVSVNGELVYAVSGHHHTPVLIYVNELLPQ